MNAGLTFSTRPGALSASRRTSSPHPDPRIPRFSPALCRTLPARVLPRAPRRPRHVRRSSGPRPGSRRTAARCPCWSSPPSPCAGPSPGPAACAIACLTRLRRFDPRFARASVRCSRRSRLRSRAVRAGQCSISSGGQGRGDRHAPVDAHRLAITWGGNRRGDHREGDMPAARAVLRHPVGLRVRRYRAGPAEPHPPGLGHPDLADVAGHPVDIPLPAAPHDPESLIPPGLAPGRPPGRVARVEERRHRPGEVAQRLLLHGLRAGQPATGARPARR